MLRLIVHTAYHVILGLVYGIFLAVFATDEQMKRIKAENQARREARKTRLLEQLNQKTVRTPVEQPLRVTANTAIEQGERVAVAPKAKDEWHGKTCRVVGGRQVCWTY
jgi:hypothetical protein